MAEEQKPVEVPKEVAPTTEAVPETKPVEEVAATTSEAAPVTTDAAPATTEAEAEAEAAPATAEEAKPEEAKKEEVTPVEEGTLEHKGQGANFPKNLLYNKKFFWFGTEPVDVKALTAFKADKVADVAHHITSWAAETGKGLLFYSEKSDKTTPHGAILLAEASEPVSEGASKFHFTSKGHKHTFKAATGAERDNWVSQLKLKISEAKELVATVTESETYKSTLASLKPAPPAKKEEKVAAPVEAPAEEAAAPAEEAPKPTEEPATEEPKKEEPKEEEAKRRSASRKRASIFGNFLGKKEEKKAAEPAAETKAAEPEVAAAEASDAVPEAAAAETTEATPVVPEVAPEVAPATVETPAEEAKKDEKPIPAKRASIFGNLGFGKKKTPEAAPAAEASKDVPASPEAVAETAPVIPAVETTEPLSAEVASPATVPTETVDATPAVNGDKKEAKAEKRKSSLPFALGGKKDKAEKATSDEEGAAKKKDSPFSKLRATIRGKKPEKAVEKTEDVPEAETAKEVDTIKEETPKPAEPEVPVAPVAQLEEETPAKPLETTPAVTAAA